MESRSHRYEISRPIPPIPPVPHPPPPPPPPPPPNPSPSSSPRSVLQGYYAPDPIQWSSKLPRPLSDIRELSEPSLMDNVVQNPHARFRHARKQSRVNIKHSGSPNRLHPPKLAAQSPTPAQIRLWPTEGGSSSYSSTPEQLSFYSIPQSSVPQRSSSHKYSSREPRSYGRNPSTQSKQTSSTLAPPLQKGYCIPNRGGGHSPVKEAGLRLDPITSDTARRVPSRTHVRSPQSSDILEFASYKHPRVKLELQVSAPVFVGGGSIEGYVRVTVDDNERLRHRRSISIGAISVDLIGFEEVDGTRKAAFIALGTDVVDTNHPPPKAMIQPISPLFADDKFWPLAPSCSALPFMISLPLDTGPPPFQSKHASIRFLLSVTAFLRDYGKHYRVRTSQDVYVLPTYDPEKALMSLPSPLTACDKLSVPRSTDIENIKITAGLHRQVWVSGSSIFVDVHILNKCRKPVRKLELTLERNILCYKHAATATAELSASLARVFQSNEQSIVARSLYKAGSVGWNGVEPHASDTRTCELEIPRGHGTVRCGKYFEVRYFLNVTASLSNSKLVSVQLPVILIHMNSLDVVPNSVAQVAAAIEERRTNRQLDRSKSSKGGGVHSRQRSVSSPARTTDLSRQPSYGQGRAFAAPRQQSLDRQREHRADIEEVRHILDSSPRKHPPTSAKGITIRKIGNSVSLASLRFPNASTETLGVLGAISYDMPSSDGQVRGLVKDAVCLRDRLRRAGSLDSMRSIRSAATSMSRKARENMWPQQQAQQQSIAPHILGLTATTRKVSVDSPSERTATAMSFRDKLDRSRFEFKAVRRKASGGLKERSMKWWEMRRHHNDKDHDVENEERGVMDREQDRAGWI